jgi:hypothetical protein
MHVYDPSGYDTAPCYFSTCDGVASVEAIATYNAVFGTDQTIAMMLCPHHAMTLQDVVVLVTTDP